MHQWSLYAQWAGISESAGSLAFFALESGYTTALACILTGSHPQYGDSDGYARTRLFIELNCCHLGSNFVPIGKHHTRTITKVYGSTSIKSSHKT
jgi:hypothetical protein